MRVKLRKAQAGTSQAAFAREPPVDALCQLPAPQAPPKELLGARPSRPQKSRRDSGAPVSSLRIGSTIGGSPASPLRGFHKRPPLPRAPDPLAVRIFHPGLYCFALSARVVLGLTHMRLPTIDKAEPSSGSAERFSDIRKSPPPEPQKQNTAVHPAPLQ